MDEAKFAEVAAIRDEEEDVADRCVALVEDLRIIATVNVTEGDWEIIERNTE